jgi:prolipoprotein diacylglyceryltransferase
MKNFLINFSIRIAVFSVSYFMIGVFVGRYFWNTLEKQTDVEALRLLIDAVGSKVGMARITSQDTYLDAISQLVNYLTLPWALLGGVCGLLLVEWIYFRQQNARKTLSVRMLTSGKPHE